MIPKLVRLLFGDRLDVLPMHRVEQLADKGLLTVREVERITKLQLAAQKANR